MSEWSAFLNRPGTEWVFLLLPAVVFFLLGLAIYQHRKRQLRRWNLRDSRVAPSTTLQSWLPSIVAVLAFVIVVGIVLDPDIAPDQRNLDIGFGISGIVIGWPGSLWAIRLANQNYLRGGGQ